MQGDRFAVHNHVSVKKWQARCWVCSSCDTQPLDLETADSSNENSSAEASRDFMNSFMNESGAELPETAVSTQEPLESIPIDSHVYSLVRQRY